MLFRLLAKAGCGIDNRRAGAAGAPLQVAAVPFRHDEAGGVEILLVTSRSSGRWILPKGWPVRGLSLAESAAKEAFEEAGVRGAADGEEIARLAIRGGDGTRRGLAVFPLPVTELLEDWPERHERRRLWMTPAEAAEHIALSALAPVLASFSAAP